MKTIHKCDVPLDGFQRKMLPPDAKIVAVAVQRQDAVTFWYEFTPMTRDLNDRGDTLVATIRFFRVYGTGHSIPDIATYVGTAFDGGYVRNHRFLEEALELVQALGCTASEAHQLVDYTFGRPIGEASQEVGGVMNTIAALCSAHGLDMMECADIELVRCWANIDKTRAKQKAKPKHGPLPAEPKAEAVDMLRELHSAMADVMVLRRLSESLEQREKAKAAIDVWRKVEDFLRLVGGA